MPIHYQWHDEKKSSILITFEGQWGWHDYLQIQDDIFQMIDEVDHLVHYVVDASTVKAMPHGILGNLLKIFRKTHPRRGITIFVGANATITKLWHVTAKLFAPGKIQRFIFVNTLSEAKTMIDNDYNGSYS